MADEDTQLDREDDRLFRARGSSAPPPSHQVDYQQQAISDDMAMRASINFLKNQLKIIELFIEIGSGQAARHDSHTLLADALDALDSAIHEKGTKIGEIKALIATARERNAQQLLATHDLKRAALGLQEAARQQDFLANIAQLNGFHGMVASDTDDDETRANCILALAERLIYDLTEIKKNLDFLMRNLKDEVDSDVADGTNDNDAGSQ